MLFKGELSYNDILSMSLKSLNELRTARIQQMEATEKAIEKGAN